MPSSESCNSWIYGCDDYFSFFTCLHEDGPTAKKLKTEEGGAHFSISSLAEGSVTSVSKAFPVCFPLCRKVGSVNPAENFRVLVKQKKASFEEGEADKVPEHTGNQSLKRPGEKLDDIVLRFKDVFLIYQDKWSHRNTKISLFGIVENTC
ncbi:hypothetical protein P7K49_013688 [Saguinus oedipus]|uniref:Uncharacterized protein n=1 Tax=Saguinus oedipus TaxID=9490 RepID=A0ABQ9VGQ9_SAGOE|nr:hypothetical protein P7K49_013688 [Saguinus oedipus]